MTEPTDRTPLDLDEVRRRWLNQCGPCDYGMPEYGCTHPEDDYRPVILELVREVEQLRAGLAVWDHTYNRLAVAVGIDPSAPFPAFDVVAEVVIRLADRERAYRHAELAAAALNEAISARMKANTEANAAIAENLELRAEVQRLRAEVAERQNDLAEAIDEARAEGDRIRAWVRGESA